MLIIYCKNCLPDKVVMGYGRRADVDLPHEIHENPYMIRNGMFPIGKEWKDIFVEGDDEQTKANIIAQFGDRFV